MLTRLISLMQLRRSTAFLLERGDDRLLDDIGLNRADLEAMHLGLDPMADRASLLRLHSLPSRRALPVAA
ncbi:hypothetical protein [Neotabrizicola shimadae]|uniref:DUF1127 domain-containing protein n=1 Tax=Neotabrizicola shimadae TaxID=2807096 RepID=A0A8G0ZXK6_9RHOB|nr:hypothetical protein [Neotabrizicola shimadae]QYZ70575.1 hypothetical protein JO391_03370 [Neotabrizicola shimadae]